MDGFARFAHCAPYSFRSWLVLGLLASSLLCGCASSSDGNGGVAGDDTDDTPDDTAEVTSGTISGLAFTVIDGTIYQDEDDGEIYADDEGGMIAFDEDTAGLGMSNPDHLRLEWEFALADGGKIRVIAFGQEDDLFVGALGFEVERAASTFTFLFDMTTDSDLSGTFDDQPSDPDESALITTELYATDTGGFTGQSGMSAWPLNDDAPDYCTDLRLDSEVGGTMAEPGEHDEFDVGYLILSGALISVLPVDDIIGLCD